MQIDYLAIAPELALTATALLVLLVDLVLKGPAKQLANPLAGLGTVVALVFTALLWGEDRAAFGGTFVINDYAVVLKLMFLGALLAVLGISFRYFAEGRYFQGEYYFLLLTSFLGMIDHAERARPAAAVRGARDRVHPRVRDGRACASATCTPPRRRSSSSSSASCRSR